MHETEKVVRDKLLDYSIDLTQYDMRCVGLDDGKASGIGRDVLVFDHKTNGVHIRVSVPTSYRGLPMLLLDSIDIDLY